MRTGRGMAMDGRMRQRLLSFVALLGSSAILLALMQPEPTTMVIAGIAALAVATTVGARYLAVVVSVHLLGVGDRAPEHTHGLNEVPAPQNPNTRGRRRTRAPALSAAVA